jgi:hypothetical protein
MPLYSSGSSGGKPWIGDTPPISYTQWPTWWNSSDGQLYVYYSGQWVQASSLSNPSQLNFFNTFVYTSTSGQVIFTGSDNNSNTLLYLPGYIMVYVNGVLLSPTYYTATNRSSVSITSGVTLGQVVQIVVFNT